jgi:hypothetical protein
MAPVYRRGLTQSNPNPISAHRIRSSRRDATPDTIPGMSDDLDTSELIALVFGVVFAAGCLWLTVRIINRREEWARWTAIGIALTMFVGYPLSLFPILWLATRDLLPSYGVGGAIVRAYVKPVETAMERGPKCIETAVEWMAEVVEPNER